MTTTRTDDLLAILQQFFNPREGGWLWLATYLDGNDGGQVSQIEGPYEDAIDTARALAGIVNGCGADHAYLALCRTGGRPREADRELWRELRRLADPAVLTDMVVFDRRQTWSMRAEDEAARC